MPFLGVAVREVLADDEAAARGELAVAAAERLGILLPLAAEAEGIADVDRPVRPRQAELVHCLLVQPRRQAVPRGLLVAEGEHVGREVAAVDVQAGLQQGKQEAARATAEVERGLAVPLDHPR